MTAIEKLLLPLDGSELSRLVLGAVDRILAIDEVEVHLLHVMPEEPSRADGFESYAQERLDAHYDLERLAKTLGLARDRVRIHMETGDPADRILETERRIRPSLTAMTTHGRTGFDRWIHGSVAERVLRGSTRPLLLVNPFERLERKVDPGDDVAPIRRILVPLDGSRESASALPFAQAIAGLYGAELILLHAPPPLTRTGAYPEVDFDSGHARALALLDPLRERLEAAGRKVRLRVGALPPAMEILEAIDDEDADLLVMTTHGRGGLSRWVFGSVAEKVLRNCRIPLLVKRVSHADERPRRRAEEAWAEG
jgi:nucleotide-binding universal stress UspA family protein